MKYEDKPIDYPFRRVLDNTRISTAVGGNWLWAFPIGEGHEEYQQILNRIAKQPLLNQALSKAQM